MATRRVKSLKESGRVKVKDARRAVLAIKSARKDAKRSGGKKRGIPDKSAKVTAGKTATGKRLIRFRIEPASAFGTPRDNPVSPRGRISF